MSTEFGDAYFERLAVLEDRHPWTRAMRRLTIDLLEREGARPGWRLLDVGCGTGLFLRDWGDRFGLTGSMGIDFAASAVRLAKRRTGAWLAEASGDALPVGAGGFDAVHSADVLQHMTKAGADEALREFWRVLRQGGLAALRVRGTRWLSGTRMVDYDHAYTEDRLGAALERAGFDVLFLRRVNVLPSLAAERRRVEEEHAPVKGIAAREEGEWRSRALAAYLALERRWILAGGPGVRGIGHTLLSVARKRGTILGI